MTPKPKSRKKGTGKVTLGWGRFYLGECVEVELGSVKPRFAFSDEDGCVHHRSGAVVRVEIRRVRPRRKR